MLVASVLKCTDGKPENIAISSLLSQLEAKFLLEFKTPFKNLPIFTAQMHTDLNRHPHAFGSPGLPARAAEYVDASYRSCSSCCQTISRSFSHSCQIKFGPEATKQCQKATALRN